MANTGYQPTWTGALPANQPQPTPQPVAAPMPQQPFVDNGQVQQQPITNPAMPVQQWQTPMMQSWSTPMVDNPLFIAMVPSDEAVHTYPVARGVTAFLVNYNEGVFWTKRQTENGLGYDIVRHYFYVDDQNQPRKNQNGSTVTDEAFARLNERVTKLQHDFEEFIK